MATNSGAWISDTGREPMCGKNGTAFKGEGEADQHLGAFAGVANGVGGEGLEKVVRQQHDENIVADDISPRFAPDGVLCL